MAQPVEENPTQQELEKSYYTRKDPLKDQLAEPRPTYKIGKTVSMAVRTDKGLRAKDFKVAGRKIGDNNKWVYSLETKDDKPYESGAWFAEADLSYA